MMKYVSSTLLFAEYIDQKDNGDATSQSDLIKTTIEFLFTNEFIALVHVKEERMKDPLAKGTINTAMAYIYFLYVYVYMYVCNNMCVICR